MLRKARRNTGYDALMRLAEQQFGMQPTMIVQIVSDYNGNGRRLQWGGVPPYDPATFPRAKFYGRYACFPLQVHDGGTLIEEGEDEKDSTLEVPPRLLEEMREAFITGLVKVETLEEIKGILARAS